MPEFQADPPSSPAELVPSALHHGRGATASPPNRFEGRLEVPDDSQLDPGDPLAAEPRRTSTEFYDDQTQSVITRNDSPDIPFRFSLNPYRGCEHGCAYCYARPYHEYLGFNAGLDFETRIMVKRDAPRLLRREFSSPKWKGEWIALSGVTDCYQPAERHFRLTRGLIEVMAECSQAFGIITKNALVARDLDLLTPLAKRSLVQVSVSLTTLDAKLARTLEPRTSTPSARLRAIAELTAAGVPVRAMLAPVIPGLNDHELPQLLGAVREAGAMSAGYILLRLPLTVEPVFAAWLAAHYPEKQARVLGLIQACRGGRMYDSRFGQRMRGAGQYAGQIEQTFTTFARRFGLDRQLPELDETQFQPPAPSDGQGRLFT